MKNKPNSLFNLLGGKNEINPIGCRNFLKNDYIALWESYDLNQYCSQIKCNNLPNGLDNWSFFRMLYYRGGLAGFKYANQVYILPFAISKGINIYGIPNAITPIPYTGKTADKGSSFLGKNFNIGVDLFGDDSDENTAVILYDSCPFSPSGTPPSRNETNKLIINEIADTLARIHINIVVSNKKILFLTKDPKQRDIIETELKSIFSSDSPFGVLSSPYEVQDLQKSSDFNADELFNTVKNWDSIRCLMSGIQSKTFGNDKKERLITAELEGDEKQANLIAEWRLSLINEFFEKCNKKFGTNMSAEFRIKDETVKDETVEVIQ